jgi:hypothetical protein
MIYRVWLFWCHFLSEVLVWLKIVVSRKIVDNLEYFVDKDEKMLIIDIFSSTINQKTLITPIHLSSLTSIQNDSHHFSYIKKAPAPSQQTL